MHWLITDSIAQSCPACPANLRDPGGLAGWQRIEEVRFAVACISEASRKSLLLHRLQLPKSRRKKGKKRDYDKVRSRTDQLDLISE